MRSSKEVKITEVPLKMDWEKHLEAVRPAIEEIDRRTMESMVRAPTIAVSNEISRKR